MDSEDCELIVSYKQVAFVPLGGCDGILRFRPASIAMERARW